MCVCASGTNQISVRTTLGLSGDSRSDRGSRYDSWLMQDFSPSTVIFWEPDFTMSLRVFILSRASFCTHSARGQRRQIRGEEKERLKEFTSAFWLHLSGQELDVPNVSPAVGLQDQNEAQTH